MYLGHKLGSWAWDNIVQAAYDNMLQNRCIMQEQQQQHKEEEQQQQARHLQRSCINYLQWPKISRQAAGEPERRRTSRHVDGGQEELQIELSSASWNNAMADRYADTQRVERGQKKRGRRMPAMPARELAANCALNCGSLCSMVTELNHRLHFCHRGRGEGAW